ncbi:MAG: RNase adapter RapZ [Myxococcota bacterium]
MTSPRSVELVIISGLSGSGKTTALRALEDVGWFCIDNLPSPLLETFLRLAEENPSIERVAVVMDVREASHFPTLSADLDALRAAGRQMRVMFLDCDDTWVINRFKETRRRHPMIASGAADTLAVAIEREREWLRPLRHHASLVIDTTGRNVHDLKKQVQELFASSGEHAMTLHLTSFGFRFGLPPEASWIFDVRFLDNPYFVDPLRALRGTDPEVADYVMRQPAATDLLARLEGIVAEVVPLSREEGQSSLTVAVGCTGGHHRSVAMVEALRAALAARGIEASVAHRDIDR